MAFNDNVAPSPFNGTVPDDLTLKCTDTVPPAETIVFEDNCVADMEVTAIEEDGGGSICEGKKTIRKWQGPHDTCGNVADTVYQMITVVDQEAPELPQSLEDLSFTCPSGFSVDAVTPPIATDDCDESVAVTKTVSNPGACGNVTITWTAKDVCDKESNVTQNVRYAGFDKRCTTG